MNTNKIAIPDEIIKQNNISMEQTHKFILLVFFLLSSYQINAQYEFKTIEIDSVEINEMDIYNIIDSLIDYEKQCGYYSDTLSFIINTYKDTSYNDTTIFSITSTNRLKILMSRYSTGYFIYKRHFFVIENELISNLFFRTSKKRLFTYSIWLVPMVDFGSHSWLYFYGNDNFIFDSGETPCPR